ncbi:MAG: Ribosomal protein L22 [candidate division TM6 bacterium GW2011_GWE2_42_60]|nr:MAG: Ribosomal protein L22 [candidate division TM6 bacterium GW2011_GWE2_42_60]HBY05572.1 50S ribosomal protein L22 [Candidatus Dependentiae bacterium]
MSMRFVAKTKYVWYSPYKLRPLADIIRGKGAVDALKWLSMYGTSRSVALQKTLASAVANAHDREQVKPADLKVCEVRIDQGPVRRYFKPGAQGRAMPQRKRQCHITVIVESKKIKEA